VRVLYDEGIANHIGPEPCVVVREGRGEASAGERIGQPLSRESHLPRGADGLRSPEGNTEGRDIASALPLGAVRDPGMCGRSLYGNREIPPPAAGTACRGSASGRR